LSRQDAVTFYVELDQFYMECEQIDCHLLNAVAIGQPSIMLSRTSKFVGDTAGECF
jgi:hypothetical protein